MDLKLGAFENLSYNHEALLDHFVPMKIERKCNRRFYIKHIYIYNIIYNILKQNSIKRHEKKSFHTKCKCWEMWFDFIILPHHMGCKQISLESNVQSAALEHRNSILLNVPGHVAAKWRRHTVQCLAQTQGLQWFRSTKSVTLIEKLLCHHVDPFGHMFTRLLDIRGL